MRNASSGSRAHQAAPYPIVGAPPFGVEGGVIALCGNVARARSTYAHQKSIDRSTAVAARLRASESCLEVGGGAGVPRVSSRSMVKVAARSCSQSHKY